MAQLPMIYVIHASDAPHHLGELKTILQTLKTENRIEGFTALPLDKQFTGLTGLVEDNDLVLTFLTHDLAPRKSEIADGLNAIRQQHPGVKAAEIIVDNVIYENEFITFPADLRPIRGREDMDAVWKEIEQSLKGMFPAEEKPEDDQDTDWKKYIKYGVAVIVIGVLIWLLPKLFSGQGPEASFAYKILDPVSGKIYNDTSECYLPCLVSFNNQSKNYERLTWDFGDTVIKGKEDPDYLFLVPGKQEIILTAGTGNRTNTFQKTLLVKAPPYANFAIDNNGCIAPCEVVFSNKSENAARYAWEFGDTSGRSDEKTPRKQYQAPGEYQVKLTVTNPDGLHDDTVKTVTVREDDSPFAEFTIQKHGKLGTIPRKITFDNSSKNADQYIWNFGDGSNAVSSGSSPDSEHTYSDAGNYTVILTAKQDNKESTVAHEFYIGPDERKFVIDYYEINNQVMKMIKNNPQVKGQLDGYIKNKVLNRRNP